MVIEYVFFSTQGRFRVRLKWTALPSKVFLAPGEKRRGEERKGKERRTTGLWINTYGYHFFDWPYEPMTFKAVGIVKG